ncbi:uncharacterized protein L969DRAFT_89192 [Mixia osmundae IAM 14324]|uniref:Extracellular membrane protein CFEM domain-containing protein n=1 Tax=Mixia osmundae (strain CBS 9802 / IAM 14324 / JCM 22182 / KY 12970) TaxID=764103 RepID=G7DSJ4_MIXOS|nr:uncharacterized protein L969DRAFT_89192 [Mixia osmundae IAM 14324]KEI37948.1 hypothetical protein L969DRAFT_89192 [Mixia osmundae IAM 14324]GAA93554.1 hypothetical protein E5Q_00198 [Mixia osmundae IAM 14324]
MLLKSIIVVSLAALGIAKPLFRLQTRQSADIGSDIGIVGSLISEDCASACSAFTQDVEACLNSSGDDVDAICYCNSDAVDQGLSSCAECLVGDPSLDLATTELVSSAASDLVTTCDAVLDNSDSDSSASSSAADISLSAVPVTTADFTGTLAAATIAVTTTNTPAPLTVTATATAQRSMATIPSRGSSTSSASNPIHTNAAKRSGIDSAVYALAIFGYILV